MRIAGLQKLTLLDYPKHIGCTIFTNGCNFCCPFCQNAPLVLHPHEQPQITESELFDFLEKRRGVLEGVCITGGEPTLQSDLISFIDKIKEFGFLVKLDTNGYQPGILEELIQTKRVNYVAMDIKNSKEKYGLTIGLESFDLDKIERSVEILLSSEVPYEFRTTVVKELHTPEDFISIGKWLYGAKNYYLQAFKDSGNLIKGGLHPYSKEEMLHIKDLVASYIPDTSLRGID